MDVNLANLRLEGDQAGVFSGFSIKFLATIQPLIQVLGNLLQLKCQNSDTAPFQTHGTIMSLVIAAVCVYFVAFMEITRPVRNTRYLLAARILCGISGVLTSILLALILFPPVGWVMLTLYTIRALHDLFPLITTELLVHGISLEMLYGSLFKQTFNRTRRAEASPQASNDNPVGQEAGDDGAHQAEAGPRATNANFMKQEGGDHGPIEICV
ncbi:hypothetical protein I3843_03G050700 [Carya illinoinensis]|uniref:uncharacterized protein LOC122305719 isoform X1 n=1 Tax=Carya illinoinensis TaxID=32201 RepID=UPI001C71C9A6|nr:uncharacterized protein LOC122305719 isoform X1 [Carya illinoinensis]KAG7985896.1 hypothetical protein I3843_03G050700 [Carya illinoinensis]